MKQVKFEGKKVNRTEWSTSLNELKVELLRIAKHHFPVQLADMTEGEDFQGYRLNSFGSDYISIELEQAWSVGVRIYLYNRPNWDDIRDDVDGVRQIPINWQPEINWSGTGRGLAQATACVNLYQQAINFVAEFISWAECTFQYIEHPVPVKIEETRTQEELSDELDEMSEPFS